MRTVLHGTGVLCIALSGFFTGNYFKNRIKSRRICLQQICRLLSYITEEIRCRKTKLEDVHSKIQVSNEFDRLHPETAPDIRQLTVPTELKDEEARCFRDCFSELGALGAQQECLRLEYYLQKFTDFCGEAQKEEARMGQLYLKLGAGVGIMAALAVL